MSDYFEDWAARNAEWAMDEAEEVVSPFPTHPGAMLKSEVLPPRDITSAALADAIGASRSEISNILNARKAVTPRMALRIEAATGYPANMLLRLQIAYDLAAAHRDEAERLSGIPRLVA